MRGQGFSSPGEVYPGAYRASVEVVADPEQRKRYRVRVANVHPQEVASDHLPWAELALGFQGSLFGDLAAFEVGDAVLVLFEGGDCRFPFIVSGILNFEGGIPPVPAEQTGDYARTNQRWTRIDRKGNKLELSPLDEELWIKIESSDGSKVQVSAKDGTVLISAEGRVQVSGPAVQVVADSITATAKTLLADIEETATLRCAGTTNIQASDEINIGEYQPPTTGAQPPLPEKSLVINIKAVNTVKIESAGLLDVDSAGETQIDSASKITVKSVSDMSIESQAKFTLTVTADSVFDLHGKCTFNVDGNTTFNLQGTTTIESAEKILINGSTDIEINATSLFKFTSGASLTIEGNANISVDATANLDLSSNGLMTLSSAARILLSAPIVTIDADSLAEVLSGSVTRVDGGVLFLG